jgi:hypothetical protein
VTFSKGFGEQVNPAPSVSTERIFHRKTVFLYLNERSELAGNSRSAEILGIKSIEYISY